VLERVPMIVRSLRRSTGKTVRLEIEGGHAELDKAVAERLFPAIVHLVRNAVDHAIESPDERARRGKREDGLVRVSCTEHSSARLVLSVTDDGRGIDREMVARRAGVEVPETDAQLLELLCRPGLSTRDEVSTLSGRGMGLDIIRRVAVEQLGGELTISTQWGVGTTFTMTVPLTVSIVDAFTFECAGQRFVVPVAIVDEIVEIDDVAAKTVAGAQGVRVFYRRGESVPLLALEEVFRLTGDRRGARKAIVVRRAGELIAFAVDRMLGQQEVVVRPLEDPLVQVPGITGATDLGDGQPTLVVDLVALGAVLRNTRGLAA
jgi:two-component system, chemotaxis family, sensor kinase CheA